MRFGILIAISSALVFAGCSSAQSSTSTVRRTQPRAAVAARPVAAPRVVTRAPATKFVRTHTVTARPVARTYVNAPTRYVAAPLGAPAIPAASTRAIGSPTLRAPARPAAPASFLPVPKLPKLQATPLFAPGLHCGGDQCIGDQCGVPDQCVGDHCGVPGPSFLTGR